MNKIINITTISLYLITSFVSLDSNSVAGSPENLEEFFFASSTLAPVTTDNSFNE